LVAWLGEQKGGFMITIHERLKGTTGKVRVTFTMPAVEYCDRLYLVGWFDEWDETAYSMERAADGTWSLTLELEPGCSYHYRFRTLDGTWLSDPSMRPAPAAFGLQNSFVISTRSQA
jgi:hypothetical protein